MSDYAVGVEVDPKQFDIPAECFNSLGGFIEKE